MIDEMADGQFREDATTKNSKTKFETTQQVDETENQQDESTFENDTVSMHEMDMPNIILNDTTSCGSVDTAFAFNLLF